MLGTASKPARERKAPAGFSIPGRRIMPDDNVDMLDALKEQVERITLDEICSPAELKLANALCVLISMVKAERLTTEVVGAHQ